MKLAGNKPQKPQSRKKSAKRGGDLFGARTIDEPKNNRVGLVFLGLSITVIGVLHVLGFIRYTYLALGLSTANLKRENPDCIYPVRGVMEGMQLGHIGSHVGAVG